MAITSRPTPPGDGDGVRIVERRGARLLLRVLAGAAGMVIVATVVAVVLIRRSAARPDPAPASASTPAPAAPAPTAPAERPAAAPAPAPSPREHVAVTPRRHDREAAPAGATPPANVGTLDGRAAILALRSAGEHGGLAAFGLPGTEPPKQGVIVPDDFELPAGYVRHYQTTDDGQQLPPILMVHPDYELVDAQGNVMPLPESRIVPPELAPSGMPIQTLQIPEAGRGGTGPRR